MRPKDKQTQEGNADAVRGGAAERTPTIRALSSYAAHTDCPTATVALASRTDLDRVTEGTEYKSSFGQDPAAFRRGETFEARLKADARYSPLIALLREKVGFPIEAARVEDLRSRHPRNRQGLHMRARETRGLLEQIARGDAKAPNIIDGAVLEAEIGGQPAFFEADSLATFHSGRLYVGEIKSFPLVDGRCDPEKFGAACDQAAWYILLVRQTIAAVGGDPGMVSEETLVIIPEGVGLKPTLTVKNVGPRVERANHLLASAPNPAELALQVPEGVSFPSRKANPEERLEKLEEVLDAVGNAYRPECLRDCGLARLCRDRAFEARAVEISSPKIVRALPGVGNLRRAAELSHQAPAAPGEEHVAVQLARAGRLYDRAAGGNP